MIVSGPLVKSWTVLQRRVIAGLRFAYVDLYGAGVSHGGLNLTLPEPSVSTCSPNQRRNWNPALVAATRNGFRSCWSR